MAYKIKKEWIPEKYKKDISNSLISSEDKSKSVQLTPIEIALDWGSGTTKILYRKGSEGIPHHFSFKYYRGLFE